MTRILGAGAIAAAFLILVGLGAWQLQRLDWKTRLLADMEQRMDAAPIPLSEALAEAPTPFVRVVVEGRFLETRPTQLYAVRNGVAGWRPHALFEDRSGRRVFVDLGFAPGDPDGLSPPPAPPEVFRIEGVLRATTTGEWFSAAPRLEERLFFTRDLRAMGRSVGEAEVLEWAIVRYPDVDPDDRYASEAAVDLRNRHLSYALTWFALAGVLIIVAWVRRRAAQRPRKGA